jgi:hypothetical protein
MPDKRTLRRVRRDKAEGKSASTQAGEFVKEEIRSIGRTKRSPRNRKQAIAIALSEARRAGVAVPPKGSKPTRRKAAHRRTAASRSASARKAARTRKSR